MQMPQEQTNDAIWNKIDEHGRAISQIKTDTAVNTSDISYLKKQNLDICSQLIATRTEIMGVVSATNASVNGLKEKELLREGAKNTWKFLGALAAVLYTVMQIAILIRTFNGG